MITPIHYLRDPGTHRGTEEEEKLVEHCKWRLSLPLGHPFGYTCKDVFTGEEHVVPRVIKNDLIERETAKRVLEVANGK